MPKLEGPLAFFVSEFETLSNDRQWSDGVPFPLTSRNLLDYFDLYGVPRSSWEAYTEAFMRIDRHWLKMQQERIKAERAKS